MKHTTWMRGWLTLAAIVAALCGLPLAFAVAGPLPELALQPGHPIGAELGLAFAIAGIGRLKELREQHTELVNKARHLLENTGAASWDDAKQAEYDAVITDAERVSRQIENHRKIAEQEAEEAFKDVDDFRVDNKAKKSEAKIAINAFFRKSFQDLSSEELTAIRNTMSTTTGSQGGYTVQSEVASTLIEALKDFGGMRREASQMTTATGVDMSWPTTDGTAEVGEIIAQNGSATAADPSFSTVAVIAYKFGSKKIAVPIELLQDSSIDVEAMIFNRLKTRIGRIQNQMFTTGTGSSQPNGVAVAASVGKIGTTGQTTTVIYDDLVDLVESLDYAYQEAGSRLCFMLPQSLRKVVRKIKDTSGRPIWTPSYDAGIAGAGADQLLGYDVCINNDMPTPAANAKSLAFGDFSKYQIRDVMDVTVFRFDDSAYISNGQIGFLAWARAGGNLLDSSAVKLYQHSAT